MYHSPQSGWTSPAPPSPAAPLTETGPSAADVAKYVVEQLKAEIDHNHSWPTKIMAFYVAVCFGIVGAIITLGGRQENKVSLLCGQRWLFILLIATLAGFTIAVLYRNHTNYVKYRGVQIKFQQQHLQAKYKEMYGLPDDWFKPFKGEVWLGVGYYVVFVLFVFALASCVIGLA